MIVDRTHTCKRCGSTDVTWVQSGRGKWYLIEVFDYDGEHRADVHDFHSRYCGKAELHDEKQVTINTVVDGEKAEREQEADKREAQRLQDEVDKLEKWYSLSPEEQAEEISILHRKIKAEARDMTMDYMGEFLKSQARIAEWQAEIDLYLSDTEVDD